MKKSRVWFLCLHAGVLLLLPLAFFYLFAVELLPEWMTGCLMHDLMFLYCPVCGGTRAAGAILSLDFLSALRYNAVVTLSCLLLLVLDAIGWWRFWKGRNPFFRLPVWFWILYPSLVAVFFVGRNLLMIFCGFDPTGDLGALWQIILRGRV